MHKKKRVNVDYFVVIAIAFLLMSYLTYIFSENDITTNLFLDQNGLNTTYQLSSSNFLQGHIQIKFDSKDYIPSDSKLIVKYGSINDSKEKKINFSNYLNEDDFKLMNTQYYVSNHNLGNGFAYTLKKYKILQPNVTVNLVATNKNDPNLTKSFNFNISLNHQKVINSSNFCFENIYVNGSDIELLSNLTLDFNNSNNSNNLNGSNNSNNLNNSNNSNGSNNSNNSNNLDGSNHSNNLNNSNSFNNSNNMNNTTDMVNLQSNNSVVECFNIDEFDISLNSSKKNYTSYQIINNRLYVNTNYTLRKEYYESDFDEFDDITVDVDIGKMYIPIENLTNGDQFMVSYQFSNYSQILLNSSIEILNSDDNTLDNNTYPYSNLSRNQSNSFDLSNSSNNITNSTFILNLTNETINLNYNNSFFNISTSNLTGFNNTSINSTLDNLTLNNLTFDINQTINSSLINTSLNFTQNLSLLNLNQSSTNNSNITIVLFKDNITKLFSNNAIRINEDVDWQKEINLSNINASDLSLIIPSSSYNTSTKFIKDNKSLRVNHVISNITLDNYVNKIIDNIGDGDKFFDNSNVVKNKIKEKNNNNNNNHEKNKHKKTDSYKNKGNNFVNPSITEVNNVQKLSGLNLTNETKFTVNSKSISFDNTDLTQIKDKIKQENLIESDNVKLISIPISKNDSGMMIVNYKTKGPKTQIKKLSNSKVQFNVMSDINYTNILSYYDLPKELSLSDAQKSIKITHVINGTKYPINLINFKDLNNNTLIDRVEWIVDHLSNQTYEIEFLVLNVHSTPAVNQHWRINFNTTGSANLSISGVNGTILGENLNFTSLSCNGSIVNASYFSNLIFVKNYSCDSYTSILSLLELKPGSHTVKFEYGDLVDYAYNRAGQLNCTLRTTGCQAHETQVLRMSNTTNAHAELPNMSSPDYNNSICCWDEGYEINITTNFTSGDALFVSLNTTTNSHVEDKTQSNYLHHIYLSSTESTFSTGVVSGMSCIAAGYQSCIVKLNNETNSHVAACNDTDPDYGNLICGSINNNAPSATLNYPVNSVTKTSTFNISYNVSDPDGINDVSTCKLYTNNGSGYVVYDDNTNVLENNNIVEYNVADNTEYHLFWYVNCTDLGNDSIVAGIRNLTVDSKSPTIDFDNKIPADLAAFNVFSVGLMNFSYNVSDISGVNTDSIILYHKTNDSSKDITYYENGTIGAQGYYTTIASKTNVANDNWLFRLSDNMVYPATYLIDEDTIVNTVHSTYLLDQTNEVIKLKLFNVSNTKQYSFLEIMANSTSTSGFKPLDVYYCNNSYVSGNVANNVNCYLFYEVPAQTPYNHSHGVNSAHIVIPFAVNSSSGLIGNVKVTPTSYFAFKGNTGFNAWNIWYIDNVARADSIQTSTDKGASWSNFAGTIDSHLHQYDGSETFYYYLCANDTLGNQKCSSERSDLINLGGLAPTSPYVYRPQENSGYNGVVQVNYTAAVSPNNYAISYYNITLLNSSFNQVQFLGQTIDLNYSFNSVSFNEGYYYLEVKACDVNGLCSSGYSEMFSIDRSVPTYSNLSAQPESPTVFVENGKYVFNATWQDNINVTDVIFEFDGTNYTYSSNEINKSGSMYFKELYGLARDTFYYKWYAFDSALNMNATTLLNYTVENEATNLTCRVTLGACSVNETSILHMSNYTNAHAQLVNISGYDYTLCCKSGVDSVDILVNYTSKGSGDLFLKLKSPDNSHVQDKTQTGYLNNIYLQSSVGNFSVDIVTGTTCQAAGYDTCIATISNATNAHIASCDNSPYDRRLCGSISNSRPTVTLNGPSDDSYQNNNFDFNYTVNSPDGLQYIDSCELYINKSSSPGYTLYDNNTNVQTNNIVTYTISDSESNSIDWYVRCKTTSNDNSTSSVWSVIADSIPPSVSNLGSNATNNRSKINATLTFSVNVTDDYINTVKIGNATLFTASQSGNIWSITKSPFNLGCSNNADCLIIANATDLAGNSNITNYTLTIYSNDAPSVPVLDDPLNSANIVDRYVNLTWNNSNDAEGDTLTYDLLLDDNNDFSSPIINVSSISEGVSQTNYLTGLLNLNVPYYWKVRAYDGELYSSYSSVSTFTILKLISIDISGNDIDFGDLYAGDQKNTSSSGMNPIIISNDGNDFANVTISADDLFTSASNPSSNYLYSVSLNESGSFNESLSQITYVSMPNISNPGNAIAYLNWNDSKDSSKVNIKVLVPDDEQSGAKNGSIYFVAEG